jgi:hypothetical protein
MTLNNLDFAGAKSNFGEKGNSDYGLLLLNQAFPAPWRQLLQ